MTRFETEGEPEKNILKSMVFLFFKFFAWIVKAIFEILLTIVSIPSQCISHILIRPFKRELRLSKKIHKLFKKLGIYSEDTKFKTFLQKRVDNLVDRGHRFFYVNNDACKREGLRCLIQTLKADFGDEISGEIHRRAKIDYEKATGKKQSIFKQGIAFIFFALAFVACLPFVVVENILIAVKKVLRFIPKKLIEEASVFKCERDIFDKEEIANAERLKELFREPHQKMVVNQLEIIDDLAAIKKKLWLGERPSGQTIGESKKELENALVEKYCAKVGKFEKSHNEISRRLEAVMAIDVTHNGCNPKKCALPSQV